MVSAISSKVFQVYLLKCRTLGHVLVSTAAGQSSKMDRGATAEPALEDSGRTHPVIASSVSTHLRCTTGSI